MTLMTFHCHNSYAAPLEKVLNGAISLLECERMSFTTESTVYADSMENSRIV